MAEPRRKHSKITQELPADVVEALHARLMEGYTYQEIVDWLEGMGHKVSRSAVGRYSKDFLLRLEKLKLVRDQAKAIVEDAGDQPETAMAEAANQVAMQLIMEALMAASDKGRRGLTKTLIEAMKALAQLEKSGVAREKLKYDFNRGRDAAVEKLKQALRDELANAPELQSQILALVERTREQVTA